MKKVLIIAKRDYLQTILTKAYLFGLILLPLILGGVALFVSFQNRGAAKQQVVLVLDRTGVSAKAVIEAAEEANSRGFLNGTGVLQRSPTFRFEEVKPEADETAQLLNISDSIRKGDVLLLLDISAEALHPPEKPARELVRFYTNSTLNPAGIWMPQAVNNGLRRVRLEQLGVSDAQIPVVLSDVALSQMNLLAKDAKSGAVSQNQKSNPVQAVTVPTALFMIMMMVTLLGAAPQMGAIAEDKMQRVYEMLLSSASPFELMLGKVLASLGVALTSSILWIAAGLVALAGLALFGFAPLELLPWFFAFLIMNVLILSATSAAIGSACSTPQDAQSLAYLLMLPIMIPTLMLTPILQAPNGTMATVVSLIPPFTPMLMLLRQGSPGGVPWWQPWAGLAGTLLWAVAVVWAAARIFRIGILSQGKAPKLSELAKWVVRG